MDTIKSALDAARAAGQAAVLCTVVERRGSAPRGPGAMMVWTGGGFAGTIGGGLVEYEAQQEARRVLETKTFTQQSYRLTNEGAADLGMVGGGHVSQALAPVLDRIDFAVTVVEERPEFLSPDLFPTARALVRADFFRLSDALTLTADDYAIVMTRGHQADLEILLQILRSPARYVGCIGSRKKVAYTQAKLREAGIDEARIQSLHSPIGLAIGAETPAEIAVSIAAQLIAHRAGAEISD